MFDFNSNLRSLNLRNLNLRIFDLIVLAARISITTLQDSQSLYASRSFVPAAAINFMFESSDALCVLSNDRATMVL